MEKMIVKVCADLEVSVNRDPRDLVADVLEAIQKHVIATPTDIRYSILSGQPVSESGLSVPRRGGGM